MAKEILINNFNPFAAFMYTGHADISPQIPASSLGPIEKRKRSEICALPKDILPSAGGLSEKLCSPACLELPLRCIIIGHNPSEQAWSKGHYYANPSNRMWSLLFEAGITPIKHDPSFDELCPITYGIGFTDLGLNNPGTDSSAFKRSKLRSWRESLYNRLESHSKRASLALRNQSNKPEWKDTCMQNGYPYVIAFSGKRQWKELFFGESATKEEKHVKPIVYGIQLSRPPLWPFPAPPEGPHVVVLTSSSGASALTNSDRLAPYLVLGNLLKNVPWHLNTED